MMILHPRDYTALRNLACLRVELGDRAVYELLGRTALLAVPGWFREFRC